MVFYVICQMTSTGILFSLFPVHVFLYIITIEDIRSLLYTALLTTHERLVHALAFSLPQSQIWAHLPQTSSLMMSPRVLVLDIMQCHLIRSKSCDLWGLRRNISVLCTFDLLSQSRGKNSSTYVGDMRRMFGFLIPHWFTLLVESMC